MLLWLDEVSLSLKVWDEELARISQRWADQCMPGHDQRRNVGEALHADHDENADAADRDIVTFNVFTKQQMRKNKKEVNRRQIRCWTERGNHLDFQKSPSNQGDLTLMFR